VTTAQEVGYSTGGYNGRLKQQERLMARRLLQTLDRLIRSSTPGLFNIIAVWWFLGAADGKMLFDPSEILSSFISRFWQR